MGDHFDVRKFMRGGYTRPTVERPPESEIIGITVEQSEMNFELARREVLQFLDTPFHEIFKELTLKKAGNSSNDLSPNPFVVLDTLKKKLNLFTSLGSAHHVESILFLVSLLKKDDVTLYETKTIPRAFKQSREEATSTAPGFWADRPFDDFIPEDVFYSCREDGKYINNGSEQFNDNTYRSYYYSTIIEVLSQFGNEGQKAMLECMREIRSIRMMPLTIEKSAKEYGKVFPDEKCVKVGKDVTENDFNKNCDWYDEYRQLLVQNKKLRFSDRRSQQEYENDAEFYIGGDNFNFLEGDLVDNNSFGERYEDVTEFGHVFRAFYESLIKTERVDTEVLEFIINSLKEVNIQEKSAYFYKILKVLNKDSITSAKLLLDFLNHQDNVKNKIDRAFASRFLYHLELGRIGINEGVVEYLDKQYQLQGEQKDQAKLAHRITSDGKVGLFDNNEILIGYIELGTLSGGEEQRQAQIMDLSRDLLFTDPDTPDEIRQQFKKDYLKFYNDLFFKETGVYFNNLSLREQLWFFQYMKKASETDKKRALDAVKEYGESALTCFIALEQDANAGKTIFSIAESEINEVTKERIFKAYAGIVEVLDDVKQRTKNFFTDNKKGEDIDVNKITSEIAKRAYGVLQEFVGMSDEKEINEKLKNISRDIITFAIIFKNIRKQNQDLNFEDVVGSDIQTLDSGVLSDEDKNKMRQVFYGNRLEIGQEFAETRVKTEFDPVVSEPGHKFCIYKQNKEILSFVRFDELPNGNLYAGFLNARTDIRGLSIGSTFFKTVLDREARGRTVEIKVRTENQSALNLYQDKLGFAIASEPYIDLVTGKEYVKMLRQPVVEVEENDLALTG